MKVTRKELNETSTYCDLCTQKIYHWQYKIEFNNIGYSSEIDINYDDICHDCAKKIHSFIKELILKI